MQTALHLLRRVHYFGQHHYVLMGVMAVLVGLLVLDRYLSSRD